MATVQFIDTSKECISYMKKLSKDALKSGGKVVTKVLQEKLPVRRGFFKKSIKAWAKVDYKTGQPYLEIGYLNRSQMRKRFGVKYFVNPTWFECSAKPHTIQTIQFKSGGKLTYELHDNRTKYGYIVKHPGMTHRNYLRNTVYENIDEINNAMKEKLKELENYQIQQGVFADIGGDEEID